MTHPGMPSPDAFADLVDLITGDVPLSDAQFAALLRDRSSQAYASELEAIWHIAGTLDPAPPSGLSPDT